MATPVSADVPLPDVEAAASLRAVNGVDLHVVSAGDPDDPLVVLLHGFPEFWYGWREYVEPFVAAGFRVLVPDQRGYNRSEKPAGIRRYRRRELSRDVVELVGTEGRSSAHVVGHDLGALVAWDLALRNPGAVDRLGVVNVPHPVVFERTIRSNLDQLRRSWYVFFFQLPRIPEWTARRNGFALWEETMRDGSNPGTFTEADFRHYRRAWGREDATTAMINWYRAFVRHRDDPPRERVEPPTLVVWGEGDEHLLAEMAPESLEYCADGRLETFSDATHWINHEHPGRVADLLVDHLRP